MPDVAKRGHLVLMLTDLRLRTPRKRLRQWKQGLQLASFGTNGWIEDGYRLSALLAGGQK